jgi:hypothetical protein
MHVSENAYASVFRCNKEKGEPVLVGPLENASINLWTRLTEHRALKKKSNESAAEASRFMGHVVYNVNTSYV